MHVAGTNMLKFTKIDQKTIKITYLILKYINACTIRITLYFNGPSANWTSTVSSVWLHFDAKDKVCVNIFLKQNIFCTRNFIHILGTNFFILGIYS